MSVANANGLHKTIRNLFDALEEADAVGEHNQMSVIDEIAAERRRQIEAEGWTLEHDDEHLYGELAAAAECYFQDGDWPDAPLHWPWEDEFWKAKDKRRNLIRSGALFVAEKERIDRRLKQVITEIERVDREEPGQ
jgi:hypothetical protein